MDSQKENNSGAIAKNEIQKTKQIKKPKFNLNIIKKSFDMPHQPENYKQIDKENDTGKRMLVDYTGNKQECDIFGFPSKKYYKNISGVSNYNLRLSKDLIKEMKFNNKSFYIPITSKFEGASMFPRPLSLPFVNQEINQLKLIKEIKKEKIFTVMRNKVILSLKEPEKDKNTIPNFMCQKISENDPTNKRQIINLINKYINKKKKEHKFELDFADKNKEIKALKAYKKNLSENLQKKYKKISECGQEDIKEKYETIRKLIYNKVYKNKNEKRNTLNNFNKFKKMNILKRVGTMNNFYKSEEVLIKNKSCTNIFGKNKIQFKNQENVPMSQKEEINDNMIKTHSLFSKFNKNRINKSNNKKVLNHSFSSLQNINKNKSSLKTSNSCIFNNKNQINLKYNINLYTPDNRMIISENKNKTSINFFTNNALSKKDINNTKDNYSFISDDKLNHLNINTDSHFKTIKSMKTNSDKEKEMLKGFQTPIEEDKIAIKHINLDKKEQALENYKNDLKILEMVNKIHFEKEKKDNLFKEKLLRKKIEGKKIFEKNFRKVHFN